MIIGHHGWGSSHRRLTQRVLWTQHASDRERQVVARALFNLHTQKKKKFFFQGKVIESLNQDNRTVPRKSHISVPDLVPGPKPVLRPHAHCLKNRWVPRREDL